MSNHAAVHEKYLQKSATSSIMSDHGEHVQI